MTAKIQPKPTFGCQDLEIGAQWSLKAEGWNPETGKWDPGTEGQDPGIAKDTRPPGPERRGQTPALIAKDVHSPLRAGTEGPDPDIAKDPFPCGPERKGRTPALRRPFCLCGPEGIESVAETVSYTHL